MEILKLLVRLIVLVSSMFIVSSCSNGWSIGGYEPNPSDSMYTFIEVMDQDSTLHFYADHVSFNQDMWCFTHNRWESIRKR